MYEKDYSLFFFYLLSVRFFYFAIYIYSPHLRHQQENKTSATTASQAGEAYHYVSYLPVNGHLYEMDGLKPWPLDHGMYYPRYHVYCAVSWLEAVLFVCRDANITILTS